MTQTGLPVLNNNDKDLRITVDDVKPKFNIVNQPQNNVNPNVKVNNRFQSGIDSAKKRNEEKEGLYNQEVLIKLGGDYNPQGELDDNIL